MARQVAGICGQPHQLIPVGDEFLQSYARYAERSIYLSDGTVDVSRSPDLFVSERAREISPVRIAGTYGSEVLRRVRSYKFGEPARNLFQPEFVASVRDADSPYKELLRSHPVSFAVFRPAPQHGVDALEHTQFSVRSPYLDNEMVKIAYRAPKSDSSASDVFANHQICLRLIEDGNPALARIRTDRGLAGPTGRLSSAAARVYQEFTFKAEYAYDYGMPQWLAGVDHALASLHLERLFLGRHKFYHFRVWYRDALAPFVKEILLDPHTLSRPYLNRSGMERMVGEHLKGNGNYTSEITKALSLEFIHRLFFDGA